MFKTCLATAAVIACTFGGFNVPSAEASEGWSNYIATRACAYLRQGKHPRIAGRMATEDGLDSSYRGQILAQARRSPSALGKTIVSKLMSTCPDTVADAAYRHY